MGDFVFYVCEMLTGFAEEMRKARKMGALKQFVVGRGSETTFAHAFEKQEAVIRYLGGVDPTGEVRFVSRFHRPRVLFEFVELVFFNRILVPTPSVGICSSSSEFY